MIEPLYFPSTKQVHGLDDLVADLEEYSKKAVHQWLEDFNLKRRTIHQQNSMDFRKLHTSSVFLCNQAAILLPLTSWKILSNVENSCYDTLEENMAEKRLPF